MSLSRLVVLAIYLVLAPVVEAAGYVVGIGAEGDSVEGRAISAFGDFGFGENTWLALAAGVSRTEGFLRTNDTRFVDAGIDHWFKPVGIRLGGSYWGNPDILDSRDIRASIYARGKTGSISLEYEKRYFEFDLQSDALRGRTAEFRADGWGLNGRVELSEKISFLIGGMAYDYSRNLRLQPDIDLLAYLSSSRLSMINSLIDQRFNAGLEFDFGLKSVDITAGRWQAAMDGSNVDSYSLGFLTPVSDRLDMEIRISRDDSETFGSTTALSVHFYYFGGS